MVESRRLATASHYLLALRPGRSRVYGAVLVYNDAVDFAGGFGADEPPADVFDYCLGVALQRISDAAGACRLEDETIALEDGHVAHFGRHVDLFAVRPDERLLGRSARLPAVHAVGVGVMPIVLVCDVAVGQETVHFLYPAPAPELAGAAGVFAGRVLLYDHGVVRLHVLGGGGEELWPRGVSAEAFLPGVGGNPAVKDLHGLERLAGLINAGVDEVGAPPLGG